MREYRRAMRRAAADAKALRVERVRNAALRAGVPVHLPAGRAFVTSYPYNGSLDVEDIHAAAVAYGVWQPEGASIITTGPGDPQLRVDADRAAMREAMMAYALQRPADTSEEGPTS